MRILLAVSAVVLLPAAALCQSMVESAALSGAAGASAAGSASATSSALSKSFGKIDSALSGAAGTPATPPAKAIPAPPAGATKRPVAAKRRGSTGPTRPSQALLESVEPGLSRADLIAKAGRPQFSISSTDDEVLRFVSAEGPTFRIRLVDGIVASVDQKPPKAVSKVTPPATPPTVAAK